MFSTNFNQCNGYNPQFQGEKEELQSLWISNILQKQALGEDHQEDIPPVFIGYSKYTEPADQYAEWVELYLQANPQPGPIPQPQPFEPEIPSSRPGPRSTTMLRDMKMRIRNQVRGVERRSDKEPIGPLKEAYLQQVYLREYEKAYDYYYIDQTFNDPLQYRQLPGRVITFGMDGTKSPDQLLYTVPLDSTLYILWVIPAVAQ